MSGKLLWIIFLVLVSNLQLSNQNKNSIMKYFKHLTYVLSYLFCLTAWSQNMQEGFTHLETGRFAQAESFFENVLKNYPDNKTANLCYGRAVGLNGNPAKANAIFTTMLEQYPDDFEIELNYAESLLWNKKYSEAKVFYAGLIEKQPQSFPALLGYANTLSNLKEYPEALSYVNKALEVSPGNANAMVSRKYIRLGYSAMLVQEKQYEEAQLMLDDNLKDFPNDKDTLLNKANIYLITKQTDEAKDAYSKIAVNANDSVVAMVGYSLADHINGKDKKALVWANKALEKAENVNDEMVIKLAKERHIQALIWNRKFKEAEAAIEEERTINPNEGYVLAASATLGMYKSDYRQSITDYENILAQDSLSFDGNLGIANAYFADGKPVEAYSAANKTLSIFKNQKDAEAFLQKLNTTYSPFVEEKLGYSFDNGKNRAYYTNTLLSVPVSTKITFNGLYQYRKTKNDNTNVEAETNDFKIGMQFQALPKLSFNLALGSSNASSFNNSYSQFLADVFFKIKPFKMHDAEIGYKRDIQNFNADLIDSEITADNMYINYNVGTNFNLGWFTQYYYTSQSDGNDRNLLFTSLYYNFMYAPVLKAGINYQYISFQERRPEVYFSPKRFNVGEVFVDFLKDEQVAESKSLFYNLNGAVGYQFIESDQKQATYRLQGKIGYKFSHRLLINLYGLHSNIASTTAAGFTYTELGFRLKWYLTSKPLFIRSEAK